MADLSITTALTVIEQALQTALLVALGKCVTTATLTTLRGLASKDRAHGELAYCTAAVYRYRFDRYSTAADDGSTVIKPTDNPTAGRWLRTTSTSSTGYLKGVELYEGESAAGEILARLRAKVPSAVIVWEGSENRPISQIPGALYDYRPRFAIWMVSTNLRPEHQAVTGSQITAESTADPGVNRILGDVKAALAGSTLSDQAGIKWVELLGERRAYTSLADRLMVYQLDVEVRATVHRPDTDSYMLDDPRMFDVQRQLVDLHDQEEWDGDNYVVSGIAVPTGASLTQTISGGSAYVNATAATYASAAKTFTASRDTYRDLSTAGALTFVEVLNGGAAPAVTTNCLRVGVTVTDASGVVSDRYICATKANFGDVDQVPPT